MSNSILAYGELLCRLSPYHHLQFIEQSQALNISFAGAEANIIADLSNLGHQTEFISSFPENPIGRKAQQFLRSFGISTRNISWDQGRLGTYYIEHGHSIRGTRVTYDRAHSSVSKWKIPMSLWEAVLSTCDYFILTGITPALSQICQDNIESALHMAKSAQVKVVFDLNYRRSLWTPDLARKAMDRILPFVDILIGNTGSVSDLFEFPQQHMEAFASLQEDTEKAIKHMQEHGDFEAIAMTIRQQNSASDNVLGGAFHQNGITFQSEAIPIEILDRLGGGDAFTAGIVHGLIKDWPEQKIVDFATACYAATQTLAGYINYLTERELLDIAEGHWKGYVKR